MNTTESRPLSRIFLVTCLAVIIAGSALSFVDLGGKSMWLDEAFTWSFVRSDWNSASEAIRTDAVNPPFQYLLIKVLTSGAALNEAVLLTPSALAQVLAIVTVSIGDRAQGVKDPKRDETPAVPAQGVQKGDWQSLSVVRAWEIQCPANGG